MKKITIYAVCAAAAVISAVSCTKEGPDRPQQDQTVEPASMDGEVVVKFAPYVSDILEKMEKGRGAVTRSGILPVDEVLDIVGGYGLERVFPSDPRYVDREKKAGLDLWYVVRFDDSEYTVDEVARKLSALGEVQTATANRVIKRSYDPAVKAVPLVASAATRSAVRNASWTGIDRFNDEYLPYQWNLVNEGEDNGSVYHIDSENPALADIRDELGGKFVKDVDVDLVASEPDGKDGAWDRCTGDPSVVVAILDEGICLDHPDLMRNIWVNEAEIPGNGIDDDGNGYVDDVHGYNFIAGKPEITWDDANDTGHATHVAGVIAAVNDNGTGISSIAGGTPDRPGVRLMSCQLFSGNMANNSVDLVKAIKYAADNGAVVLQCSFGYTSGEANSYTYGQGYRTQEEWEENCPLEKIALDYFVNNAGSANGPIDGGLAVFASGNEYAPAAGYPGAADICISVASTAGDATPATYTNYSTGTKISAPGGDRDYYFEYLGNGDNGIGASDRGAVGTILSTLPENISASGYGYMEGTSMACPHVSGVIALGISYAAQRHLHFTSDEFRQLLFDTANKDMVENAVSGRKFYYMYVSDLGLAHRTYFSMNTYSGQMGAGQVDAGALLDAIDGGAGTPMRFPNIYLAAGSEVTVAPGLYLEGTGFSVSVDDTSVAAAETSDGGSKIVFTGLKAGSTSATVSSGGQSQDFVITVRNSTGEGWL